VSVQSVYTVSGMTCGHCVSSVTEEISELSGVTDVAVVLETGAVTVTSADQLDRATVEAAVSGAGFQLTA